MIRIREEDADIQILFQIARGERFHCCLRANGHKDRSFDCAVCRMQEAGPRAGSSTLRLYVEAESRYQGLFLPMPGASVACNVQRDYRQDTRSCQCSSRDQ